MQKQPYTCCKPHFHASPLQVAHVERVQLAHRAQPHDPGVRHMHTTAAHIQLRASVDVGIGGFRFPASGTCASHLLTPNCAPDWRGHCIMALHYGVPALKYGKLRHCIQHCIAALYRRSMGRMCCAWEYHVTPHTTTTNPTPPQPTQVTSGYFSRMRVPVRWASPLVGNAKAGYVDQTCS